MFAIIKTGGKQLLVQKDQEIFIEKLDGVENDIVEFNEVLLIDKNVGNPTLENAKVIGQIIRQGKEKKIIVFKYKPKKNSKSKYGHRQPYTRVKITDILLDGTKKLEPAVKKAVSKTTKKVTEVINDGSSSDSKASE